MSYLYVCPKCGRSHTKAEYIGSMFCRECGKFLTGRNRVNVSSSRGQKMGSKEWSLFPYEPYPQQLEFMRDVKNVVGNRDVLVTEACNVQL